MNTLTCRPIISLYILDSSTVAYLRFQFGGGDVEISFSEVMVFAWCEWGFGGMPPKKFFKMVQFGALWSIFFWNFVKKEAYPLFGGLSFDTCSPCWGLFLQHFSSCGDFSQLLVSHISN